MKFAIRFTLITLLMISMRSAAVPTAPAAGTIGTFLLNVEERALLQKMRVIRIGLPNAIAPYERLDANEGWKGFAADLLQPLFKQAGVDVKLVLLTDSPSPYQALEENLVDIMVAAPIDSAPLRSGILTPHYDEIEWGLVRPVDRANIEHKLPTLTMVEWNTRDEPEIALEGKLYARQTATNIGEALTHVHDGRADAAFVSVEAARALIERHFVGQLALRELTPPYFERIGFITPLHQPALASLLTRYLEALDAYELPRLREKWHVARSKAGYGIGEIATIVVPTLVTLLLIIASLMAINRRITAARAEAEAANRAKSVFLSTMSHEIRTPMNGVLGVLDILSRTQLDTEQSRWIRVAKQAAQTLLKVIDDALDYAKIEAGRLEVEFHPLDLATEIGSVVDLFASRAQEKQISLTLSIAPELKSPILGDAIRLRQLIGNLLSNSIRFTAIGGVQISVTPLIELDRLQIAVSDTGIGIAPELQKKLFSPFEQADSSTTRRFGGTGLGLAIVKRLTETMDGEVSLYSVPNEGTTVTVQLPWITSNAPVETGPIPPPTPLLNFSKKPRILLVEDNPLNREIIGRQLAIHGFETDFAEDGEAGLAEWQRLRPPIMLLDCHLPKRDGYDVARCIREIEQQEGAQTQHPRTIIIAVSANALVGEAEKSRAAGMDDHLAKPVTADALNARLEYWLTSMHIPLA